MENYPSEWRFCPVVGKIPQGTGWQNKPYTLNQITSSGIGLLFGPVSNGVMAIDFDGPWGWEFFEREIGFELPDTISWCSGKLARGQFAFSVPEEAWPIVRTLKRSHPDKTIKEGIEFRWTGCQSVLPPSPHPDTGLYKWLTSPNDIELAPLPFKILEWWVSTVNYKPPEPFYQSDHKYDDVVDEVLVKTCLEKLKDRIPNPGYDDWFHIAAALYGTFRNKLQAQAMMQLLWPEQKRDEYRKLFDAVDLNVAPKLGTLVWMVKNFEPDFPSKPKDPTEQLLERLKWSKTRCKS